MVGCTLSQKIIQMSITMKINISRPSLYLISLSLILFIFILLFSFLLLIPKGKEYRKERIEVKKAQKALRKYQNFHDETAKNLQSLQKKNRNTIIAFDKTFNKERFLQQYKGYFSSLELSPLEAPVKNDEFVSYEVNTSSQISSPKSFYDFIDALNKADWIIGVNFPIAFERDGELIKSSFTMKVYCADKNTTKEKVKKPKAP